MPPARHLYLTGYRGTGKTSVGVLLARALGRPVVDLDQVVEANRGQSIREIFDEGGESLFRDLESEALETVSQAPAAVVSLGGGAILRDSNREIIRTTGHCVWLDADAETIAGRIRCDASTADKRPALTALGEREEIRELLDRRREFYDQAADYRIDTTEKSIEQVAQQILDWLQGESRPEGG
jgi:shikimate kinase